ncbi:alpha/beta hydrolase [Pseudorhodoferax sp. Leaf267]|uniref:alpha/beta hydrolase n=1 Tax=Pseudorhodoferax sp. Leaf267 TaxID=1736316 RepID=UPI0006F30FC8|nr:alpha/beta hydrolase [Pseudorhodoferax sp. Leaf267]KQP14889.1 alpha/beta hydrolase [Pseudorhodoferax sp. Leaf267]
MQPDPTTLLTPAMRGVIDRMVRAGHPPLYTLAPPMARKAYEAGAGVLEIPSRALARTEDFTLPARDGYAIPVRLVAPASAAPLPVLVYFHGGGFTIGSIATHDTLCRELAHLAGCAVLSVDYRLAPEHRFPTAQHDAWDALQGLAERAGSLGLDATRLAVGGDSAGGTLAAVCALLAREAGLPLALQLLFYPGCTAHQDTPSHQRFAEGFVLDAASIRWFFDQVQPDVLARADWRFAPLNADEVDGVAPAWIGLAECDPLVDEGVLYADKLRAAGVAVDLEIYRGVVHEFIKMGRAIPQARTAHADATRALAAALHIQGST